MLDRHCKQGFDQQCVTFAVSQKNVGMDEKFREFFLSRQKTCLSRNPKNGEKKSFWFLHFNKIRQQRVPRLTSWRRSKSPNGQARMAKTRLPNLPNTWHWTWHNLWIDINWHLQRAEGCTFPIIQMQQAQIGLGNTDIPYRAMLVTIQFNT